MGFHHHRRALATHLANRGLPFLFLIGFVLMGSFVTLYNYVGYRLLARAVQVEPDGRSARSSSVYLTGVVASPWSGKMADIFGRGRVLIASLLLMIGGVLLTLSMSLPVIIGGIACVTFGFFAGHAVASGWVGRLAEAGQGAGGGALSARVLHRLERDRLLWRPFLDGLRMGRRRGTHRRAAAVRAGGRDLFASARGRARPVGVTAFKTFSKGKRKRWNIRVLARLLN